MCFHLQGATAWHNLHPGQWLASCWFERLRVAHAMHAIMLWACTSLKFRLLRRPWQQCFMVDICLLHWMAPAAVCYWFQSCLRMLKLLSLCLVIILLLQPNWAVPCCASGWSRCRLEIVTFDKMCCLGCLLSGATAGNRQTLVKTTRMFSASTSFRPHASWWHYECFRR